jgi:hypothetical protein
MSAAYTPRLSWEAAFLGALAKSKLIKRSAHEAGITTGAVYGLRDRSEAFARECKRVLQCDEDAKRAPAPTHWKRVFLETLAETSNVTASAERADVTVSEVYKTRRDNNEFAGQWQAALFEGYTNLEMELLGYLRDPKAERKMDVANALRLLSAHKESHIKERAVRANVSAAEIRASIERKVEVLRKKVVTENTRQSQ